MIRNKGSASSIADQDGSEPTVVVRGLTAGYGHGPDAVRGVDLELRSGSVTALVGPNGSGKSTLLSAIAGLLRPRAGDVRVLGATPDQRRARIASVLQTVSVAPQVPLTVREVVAMGRYPHLGVLGRATAADRDAVERAMDRLSIGHLGGRPIQALSGGQRQRAFVAQGLAQEADVLLLDEPVSGLDAVSEQRILAIVHEEAELGRTVVLSTHDLAEAAGLDHLVLLAGRVVASGAPEDVLTDAHLSAAYGSRVIRLGTGGLLVDDGSHHHGHLHHEGPHDGHDHG